MPSPQSVLDAAPLIATAGAATATVVQMVKVFLGVESSRARVLTALIMGTGLTLLYAFSNALLTGPNAFALAIASITITAAGAGIHSAVTATATDRPGSPPPSP